jgi:hypothetical protein
MTETLTASAATLARLNNTMQKGSLADLAKAARRSILLADCSGSMHGIIRSGERRIDALRKIWTELSETHPVPTVAFGTSSRDSLTFIDRGMSLPEPCAGTPIHTAIRYAKANGATHIVLITDGQPDSETAAFAAADEFGHPIDCFYIGDGDDSGARFTRELAARTGGTANLADLLKPKELRAGIAGLLGDGSL